MRKFVTILVAFISIGTVPAHALRCNGKLIVPGDEKQKILDSCGEPADIHYYDTYPEQPVYYNHSHNEYYTHSSEYLLPVTIEVWTYNFGPGKFIRELHIKDNRIISIGRSRYGN